MMILHSVIRARLAQAFAAVLLMACAPIVSAQLLHSTVAQGELAGSARGSVAAYLGVPFAAPPTGEYRWTMPRAPARWSGVRKAEHFSASCQQTVTPDGFGPWTAEYVVSGAVSEDCLYLNVWTPAKTARDALAVLVYIPGGGFDAGSGSVPIYDGAALAAKGIIVVTVNYRLGVYGFLAHPELSAQSPAHASGNYGLFDMVAALQWVRDNIAALGGDPARVTLAGQSAGGVATHHLIASPVAKGLFSRAIVASASPTLVPTPDLPAAERVGMDLSAVGSALSIAQLRRLSTAELGSRVEKLMQSRPPTRGPPLLFGPIIDGVLLPSAASVGAVTNNTPLLMGVTADETRGFDPNLGKRTVASFRNELAETYGALSTDAIALYPAHSDAEAQSEAAAHSRDRTVGSMYSYLTVDRGASRTVYAYLWAHPEPGPESARYGAFHSSDIPYFFDTLAAAANRPFQAADRALAAKASAYWANFVNTGDPNGKGLPEWPKFTSAGKGLLELGDPIRSRPLLEENKLALFDRYKKNGGRLEIN